MERLYALNRGRPAQQLAGNTNAKLGEVLNLRVEARTPNSVTLRNADGRSFQINTNSRLAPDAEMEPGQTLRAQVTSVKPLQLSILTAAPSSFGAAAAQAAATPAPSAMAVAAQMQAQKASGQPIAPDQLLLQRLLQATGAEAVAQAWRGLALARMQQPDPQPMLPQFWMFHAYAWNESLPLSFWLLRRQEDEAPPPQPPSRLLKLRLRFHHPVYGWMLLDVYVDEMNVALNIHIEPKEDAGELTSRLRPAISAALAHAGLRLLQFHVRADLMNSQDHAGMEPDLRPSGSLTVSEALPEADLLHQAETALAPALFLAAAEVLEALRAA